MKKFLVFLVSLVVVVCVGLTTYYFMRNNEIITIKTKEIYCNAGDTIPLDSLGINIKRANVSKKTSFDYNAGGEDVTKYISYDENSKAYVVSQENAGDVTLVIRTTNNKYSDFTISVHIGNGSIENPYYIFSETDLLKIGSTYRLDSHYRLMNDITLTSEFSPIGYNSNTSIWEGFNGTFDGNNHTIKGMNLNSVDAESVGFFSSVGANGTIKNLTLTNATIAGEYKNVGVVAGVVNGTIDKVAVTNSSISNSANDGKVGSIAGSVAGEIKMVYADNVEINVSGTEESQLTNVTVGGLVGAINETTVQACYTNDVEINLAYAQALIGGFAGEFVIGTESGSIQQSYANTICSNDGFAGFIGKITPNADFDSAKANMLRHLIGNFAIVYGVESSSAITDNMLIANYDNTFFKNSVYETRSAFFEKDSALYLVRGFANASEVISTNEFIYYAINVNTITDWDTAYVWNVANNALPKLRMGNIYPASPSSEYLRRNLEEIDLGNKKNFVEIFSSNVENESIKLSSDIDLTNGWTPVSVSNSTIDGAGHTITINLNNASSGSLGLFTSINNSTIKNLNIIVTGVSANATNAGALAGIITSDDALTTSLIENVTVSYQGFATPVITNFGGIAGVVENAVIKNVNVSGLNISDDAQIKNAGAIVGTLSTNAQINNAVISATVSANETVGGVAGVNNGTITNVTGSVVVNGNSTLSSSYVAGVVASNNGTIDTVTLTVAGNVKKSGSTVYLAGVVAINAGKVSNVVVNGSSVSISVNNSSAIYVGGVVASNNGTIENVTNNIENVGTYYVGANHYVGGVAAINSGSISKVLTQSNLNGNYVSGVVAQMNYSSATIDQVAVGKYNAQTKQLSHNAFVADKYLAGIAVDFKAGTITNVQSASNLIGQTNTTRSSAVVLIFPYGANLRNATINNALTGYGLRYREVWTDFASYNNKGEFGLANGETGDERFNLYKYDTFHGCMQSVVINNSNAGVSTASASMGAAFAWGKDYQDTADSSFVKVVEGFNDFSQFQGSFTFVCARSTVFGIEHKATKTLTFAIGSVWRSNSGISLMFLDNIA